MFHENGTGVLFVVAIEAVEAGVFFVKFTFERDAALAGDFATDASRAFHLLLPVHCDDEETVRAEVADFPSEPAEYQPLHAPAIAVAKEIAHRETHAIVAEDHHNCTRALPTDAREHARERGASSIAYVVEREHPHHAREEIDQNVVVGRECRSDVVPQRIDHRGEEHGHHKG